MYANTQVLAQASRRQAERMRQQKVNLSSSGSSALTIGALGGRPKSLERSDVSISIKTTRAGLFAADTLISSRWGSSCTSPLEDKVIRLGLTNALSTKPEDNIEVSCANKPSIWFQYLRCSSRSWPIQPATRGKVGPESESSIHRTRPASEAGRNFVLGHCDLNCFYLAHQRASIHLPFGYSSTATFHPHPTLASESVLIFPVRFVWWFDRFLLCRVDDKATALYRPEDAHSIM